MRKAYQTDLSDAEWSYVEAYLPTPKAPERPRVHTLREIVDAIFYIVRSGCAWRLLPHDFPPWKTVHHYLRIWRKDGTFERIHAALRERLRVRLKRGADEAFPRLSHLWLDAGYRGVDKGQTGWRRPWGGAWISSSAHESPLPKKY
jgi:putative transposase